MSDKLKAVIHYIIETKKVKNLTHRKLQKLLYYAYSWNMVLSDNHDKLFPERFEVWVAGPALREVHKKYKNNKDKFIKKSELENIDYKLTFDEEQIIDETILVYGDFSDDDLEEISRSEQPWKNARGNSRSLDKCYNELSDDDIFKCYSERIN